MIFAKNYIELNNINKLYAISDGTKKRWEKREEETMKRMSSNVLFSFQHHTGLDAMTSRCTKMGEEEPKNGFLGFLRRNFVFLITVKSRIQATQ